MATNTILKKNNMLQLINIIRNCGAITKPEIAKLSKFTSVTVHNFVNELIEKNIILEEGIADSNGGRRAIIYRFNSKIFYIIGINIAVKKVVVSVFDLDLNIINSVSQKCELADSTVDEGIRFILDLVSLLIDKTGISKEKIIGIGVSVPGPVNYSKGLIYNLPNLPKWRNVPLKDIIESEIKLPVFIDKDNNASLLSLKWKNVLKNNDNVVFLCTSEGIGTGILINGEIFRGNHNAAGEVGHITVEIDGPKCNCGNNGCIELYASDLAIINSLIKGLQSKKEGILYELCQGDSSKISMSLAIEAVQKNDPFVKEVFTRAGKYMGICISNILKVYAPTEVIIESTWLNEFSEIFYSILDYVYETGNFFERNDVRITLNTVENSFMTGSATIVLDHLLKTPEDNKLLSQIV
jgi:predicted NBD/HSP70 family sugar kinase